MLVHALGILWDLFWKFYGDSKIAVIDRFGQMNKSSKRGKWKEKSANNGRSCMREIFRS